VFDRTADHEDIMGSGCIITRIPNVDVRDECSVSHPSHFNPEEEEVTSTSWIRNFMKPRSGLEALEKRKISCPYRELNADSFVVQVIKKSHTS
jgi:hypothetical protein